MSKTVKSNTKNVTVPKPKDPGLVYTFNDNCRYCPYAILEDDSLAWCCEKNAFEACQNNELDDFFAKGDY